MPIIRINCYRAVSRLLTEYYVSHLILITIHEVDLPSPILLTRIPNFSKRSDSSKAAYPKKLELALDPGSLAPDVLTTMLTLHVVPQ